jgi:23S rRNA (pseudouridine1915-N3)-methyltransferase
VKIRLLVVGKTAQDFVEIGVQEFCGRLKHYLPFEMQVIPDLKTIKNLSLEQQKEKEGELILQKINSGDVVVLLDEHGKEFTSTQFSVYLERKMHTVSGNLTFVIGGAYGFSPQVYAAAQEKIALSKMTFSHQMIRLIFVEQLYRAMTILHNQPYHHE